jgi:hypothetical protein
LEGRESLYRVKSNPHIHSYPATSQNLTPSPFFHPNGTMFIVFHCDKDQAHAMCDLSMVRSTAVAPTPSWRGPFVRVNDKIWDSAGTAPHPEDPFFWIRTSPKTGAVSYHVVMHNTPVGIHIFSADGLIFQLQQQRVGQNPVAPFVYPARVNQTDGSSFSAGRRERPWILFAPNSTRPQVLVTSMQAPVFGRVFTHAQEIN